MANLCSDGWQGLSVTLDLGINSNRICYQSCTEDPDDEGTACFVEQTASLPKHGSSYN